MLQCCMQYYNNYSVAVLHAVLVAGCIVLQRCNVNVAVLQCCSVTVTVAMLCCMQCCNVSVLQCFSVAMLQCCNVAVLQCCSLACTAL